MTIQDQYKPLKRVDLIAALAIFLIPPMAYLLVSLIGAGNMDKLPEWLGYILGFLFLGSFIFLLGLAIIRGLPRWSPPYLGVLIAWLLLLGPFWLLNRLGEWVFSHVWPLLGPMSTWSMLNRVLWQGYQNAIKWSLVLLCAMILITLLRIFPDTRSVWRRVRVDWTQLSFLVYGGIVLNILLIFDEYRQDELWQFASWLSLGIGCWAYLHSQEKYQRILILLCGATLAMWIVAVGKWILVPIQDWGPYFKSYPPETERWFEFFRTMAEWICIVAALLAPALLDLLPRTPKPIPEENPALV